MDVSNSWGVIDYLQATGAITYIILQSLFFVWLFRKIIGGVCILVFEREKVHAILGYAADKNTPLLAKPFAFVLWLVLMIASCVFSIIFSIFLLNFIDNLFNNDR